jgi:glycosyltransferase involved in cell wall biosynthesis
MASTIVYILLSPTFGMHQYTADLAHQAAALGYDAHVITTTALPRDRYAAHVRLHTPVAHATTGFAMEGARLGGANRVWRQVLALRPDVVHFTGVHLWNPLLLAALRSRGIRTIHTLHDLEPHPGVHFGRLIRLWNQLVVANAGQLLVHAQRYQRWLAERSAGRLHGWPLTHTFLGAAADAELAANPPPRTWEPWVLYFGRVEPYKGVDTLLAAARQQTGVQPSVVVAGRSRSSLEPLPPGVLHINQHIDDRLGWELFRRCRAVVLPYTGATQSALPAAAYAFGKPAIVSDSGALAESVTPGATGWVTPSGDAAALAVALADARRRTPDELAVLGDAGRRWRNAARIQERSLLKELYTGRPNVHAGPIDGAHPLPPGKLCDTTASLYESAER